MYKKFFLCVLIVIFLFSISSCKKDYNQDFDVRVTAINVGKADSILVQLCGKNYLIDTGTAKSVGSLFSCLGLCSVNKIDGLFITHMHSDHMGGVESLLKGYIVDNMYCADIQYDSIDNQIITQQAAENYNVKYTNLSQGNTVKVNNDICFEVLGPISKGSNDNDNSLVLRLNAYGKTYLFTGDMQFEEELSLSSKYSDLSADYLKVGNHGNPDATSDSFADKVSPEIAVISTDVSEDSDSANERVYNALSMADIYCTQDYNYGVCVICKNEKFEVYSFDTVKKEFDISVECNVDDKTITLYNKSDKQYDLSGCFITESKKNKTFILPYGTIIKSKEKLVIGNDNETCDILFDSQKYIKSDDTVVFHDKYGNDYKS